MRLVLIHWGLISSSQTALELAISKQQLCLCSWWTFGGMWYRRTRHSQPVALVTSRGLQLSAPAQLRAGEGWASRPWASPAASWAHLTVMWHRRTLKTSSPCERVAAPKEFQISLTEGVNCTAASKEQTKTCFFPAVTDLPRVCVWGSSDAVPRAGTLTVTVCDTEQMQLLCSGSISPVPFPVTDGILPWKQCTNNQNYDYSCSYSASMPLFPAALMTGRCSGNTKKYTEKVEVGAPTALQGCCFPALVGMSLQYLPESLTLLSRRGPGSSVSPLALECVGTEVQWQSCQAAPGLAGSGDTSLPQVPCPAQPAVLSCSVHFFYQESRSLVSLTFSPLKLHGNSED